MKDPSKLKPKPVTHLLDQSLLRLFSEAAIKQQRPYIAINW